MVFSSHSFLFIFMPLALALYFATPERGRNLTLTITSFVFYGWTNPAYIVLLLFSTFVDWYAGLVQGTNRWLPLGAAPRRLEIGGPRTRTQRAALLLSIFCNLGLLAFFKYFHFTLDSWNAAVAALGLGQATIETAITVVLPLGISFYSFEALSYSIDVYRGHAQPRRSFVDFACFVSMWPQLVAGPIVRYTEIDDQILRRKVSLEWFARGVGFFSLGLAKKVLLANPCGKIADTVFDAASSSALDAWYGLVAYSFQIYYDFSGYSDMAIGLGLMIGFMFPKNFDAPYRSRSVGEFWRRWHLSLSTWLRDYLYLPLGGNRLGTRRTYLNLAAVMLIGGLWHGASWNFVLWGGFHGAFLIAERALGAERLWGWLPAPLRTFAIFGLVTLTWVPFRAADFAATWDFYGRLFGLATPTAAAALLPGLLSSPYLVLTFLCAGAIAWSAPQTWTWTREMGVGKSALALLLFALCALALATQEFNPFIYFLF